MTGQETEEMFINEYDLNVQARQVAKSNQENRAPDAAKPSVEVPLPGTKLAAIGCYFVSNCPVPLVTTRFPHLPPVALPSVCHLMVSIPGCALPAAVNLENDDAKNAMSVCPAVEGDGTLTSKNSVPPIRVASQSNTLCSVFNLIICHFPLFAPANISHTHQLKKVITRINCGQNTTKSKSIELAGSPHLSNPEQSVSGITKKANDFSSDQPRCFALASKACAPSKSTETHVKSWKSLVRG